MSVMSNVIAPLTTRLLGIAFRDGNNQTNPNIKATSSSFTVNNVAISDIVRAVIAVPGAEYLGSFVAVSVVPTSSKANDEPIVPTQFALVVTNFGCNPADMSDSIAALKAMPWVDGNTPVKANAALYGSPLDYAQLLTLLTFRQALPNCNYLTQMTLVALNMQYGTTNSQMAQLLDVIHATSQGDSTIPEDGPNTEEDKWARELFSRLTTGGPNGSMAGKIAVEFMDKDDLASFSVKRIDDQTWAVLKDILRTTLIAAGAAGAQAIADYLRSLPPSSTSGDTRQVATVVKGIKDSMPNTGKTIAQLAVWRAIGSDAFKNILPSRQLRAAYTIANTTRAMIESFGNHVADLYQEKPLPTDQELAAVGARDLLSFLKSVGSTVANGVMQAAPVILTAISTSVNANNALGNTLPPSFAVLEEPISELDPATRMILASRIVSATPNPQSSVVSDKAVSDLADRQSTLGSQATFDTYSTLGPNVPKETALRFQDLALKVAAVSPTFANVTDIGATNLVTDTSLKHSDALRQHTLEMGIRSCASIITDNSSAEILYKVHLHRLQNGTEAQPRDILDFLKSAVPIAANIAKVAAPALMALL